MWVQSKKKQSALIEEKNTSGQLRIGHSFASHWMWRWGEFFKAVIVGGKGKPNYFWLSNWSSNNSTYHIHAISILVGFSIFIIGRVKKLESCRPFFIFFIVIASLGSNSTHLILFTKINLKPVCFFIVLWKPTVTWLVKKSSILRGVFFTSIIGWSCHLIVRDDAGTGNTNRVIKAFVEDFCAKLLPSGFNK